MLVAIWGALALERLPIDAVPDITNNQVQINAVAPALSPFEVEKQVTFTMENALAGIPGLQSTRSLSRNGFAQVTAVFEDGVDIYFARQQVGERLREASDNPRFKELTQIRIDPKRFAWEFEVVHEELIYRLRRYQSTPDQGAVRCDASWKTT